MVNSALSIGSAIKQALFESNALDEDDPESYGGNHHQEYDWTDNLNSQHTVEDTSTFGKGQGYANALELLNNSSVNLAGDRNNRPMKASMLRAGAGAERGRTMARRNASATSRSERPSASPVPKKAFMAKGSGMGGKGMRVASAGGSSRKKREEVIIPKRYVTPRKERPAVVSAGGGRRTVEKPVMPKIPYVAPGGKGAAYMRSGSVERVRVERPRSNSPLRPFMPRGSGTGGRGRYVPNPEKGPRVMREDYRPNLPVKDRSYRRSTSLSPAPEMDDDPVFIRSIPSLRDRRRAAVHTVVAEVPRIVTDIERFKSVQALADIVTVFENEDFVLPTNREGLEAFRDIYHQAVPYLHLTGVQDPYTMTFNYFRSIENRRREARGEGDTVLLGSARKFDDPDRDMIRYNVTARWGAPSGRYQPGMASLSSTRRSQPTPVRRGQSVINLENTNYEP